MLRQMIDILLTEYICIGFIFMEKLDLHVLAIFITLKAYTLDTDII